MRKFYYVTSMGGIWKMGQRDYNRLKDEIARTGHVENMDFYGKMIIDHFETIKDIECSMIEVRNDDDPDAPLRETGGQVL